MEYIRAFITGGIICILVQILMDHTTLQPGRIMVILVIAGVLLGALGIYKKIEESTTDENVLSYIKELESNENGGYYE